MTKIAPSKAKAIIPIWHKDKNFAFHLLSGAALGAFESELPTLSSSRAATAKRALIYFEYLLKLTKHPPITSVLELDGPDFLQLQRLFYGAINSRLFLAPDISKKSRYRLVKYFFDLLKQVSTKTPVQFFQYNRITTRQRECCLAEFESLSLDPIEAKRISGWYVCDRSGGTYRLQITSVHDIVGAKFTSGLYAAISRDALKHANYVNRAAIASRLDDFVYWCHKNKACQQPIAERAFKNPLFVHEFFWKFQRWHFESYTQRSEKGSPKRALANLQGQWIRIIDWTKSVLLDNDLMVSPLGGVWPEGNKKLRRYGHEVGHHRYADGESLISQKLITPVPLEITDQEATEILFRRIERDFNIVVEWAKKQINLTESYLTKLEEAYHTGELVTLGKSQSKKGFRNREIVLTNLVRTINEKNGGFLIMDKFLRHHLSPKCTGVSLAVPELALNLALPTKYVIAPFAIYLVAQHPILTDSALLGCELYNKEGKLTGLQKTDAGALLVVKKDRKGAQQEILLTKDTAAVVDLLIRITGPLRTYLKARNDAQWRRLFIVAGGQGFQKPYVFTNKTGFAKILRQREFVNSHRKNLGELAQSITLARIRATAGIIVYLKTLSISAMADALGNTTKVALNYYLPAPILQFFQERWIRIFQNAMIVSALKDSPCLLLATDFTSMSEVDEFLKNHALRLLPDSCQLNPDGKNKQKPHAAGRSELVISINDKILAILLS